MNKQEDVDEIINVILELMEKEHIKCFAKINSITTFFPSKECIEEFGSLNRILQWINRTVSDRYIIKVKNIEDKSIIAFKSHNNIFIIIPRVNKEKYVINSLRKHLKS